MKAVILFFPHWAKQNNGDDLREIKNYFFKH